MSQHHTFRDMRASTPPSFGKRGVANDLHAELTGVHSANVRLRRGRTLRVALGFAAFGIAAAIWAGPNVEDAAYNLALTWQGGDADELTTASVRAAPTADASEGQVRSYVVRRSVLQAPGEVCTIENGVTTCEGGLRD